MASVYRRLLLPVYLPTLLTSTCNGAILVLLPVYLLDAGYSVTAVSFIIALRDAGTLLLDLPAGLYANRRGDKPAMLLGVAGMLVAVLLLTVSNAILPVLIAALFLGGSMSFNLTGRVSYISDTCEVHERGRVIALMAGLQRAGYLLGPLAFSLTAGGIGFRATFGIMALLLAGSLLCVMAFAQRLAAAERSGVPLSGMLRVLKDYRRVLLTAGVAGLSLMMLRAARLLLLPLAGHGAGLDVAQIGLLFSLSATVDTLMFYPAGQVMDRRGRKWTAVPGMLVLALSLGLLAVMPGINGLLVFAVLSGLGNGITTGVLLTMGSDLAPAAERNHFMGLWRLQLDVGNMLAPFLVGTLAEMLSLAVTTFTIMGFGLAGAAVLVCCVSETLERARHGRQS